MQEQRWEQARTVLEGLLRSGDGETVVEAAYGIGETYERQGELLAAAEYYMTAAYVGPQTGPGRRGLLGAGRSFAGLKQVEAAVVAYQKLLAQADVPAELTAAARQGLAALGR
jgi:tetratricopeptide (TPR) repeat protein